MNRLERRRAGLAVVMTVAMTGTVLAATLAQPMTAALAGAGDVWVDTSYGAQGVAESTDAGGPAAVAVDPTDRLYVATSNGASTRLRRLTADGVVDPGFAGGGVTLPPVVGGMHADAGGTVTVVGTVPEPSTAGTTVVSRYTGSGSPDPGFGGGGPVAVLPDIVMPAVIGVLGRPAGGVLIALGEFTPSGRRTQLVALTSTGALDATWAAGAPQPGVLSVAADPQAVAADGSGVMLLAYPDAANPSTQYLLRFTATGAPDPGFGTGGRANLPGFDTFVPASLATSGGAAFVGGYQPGDSAWAMAVVKLLATGALDAGFGTGGLAHGQSSECGPIGFAVQVSGSHVFVGGGFTGCRPDTVLIDRFTPAGVPDPAFGTGGELAIDPTGPDRIGGTFALGLQSTGRLLVSVGTGNARQLTFRLLGTGTAPAGGSFVPLAPARILDTRSGNGAVAGAVPGGGSVDLQVTGRGGIPSSGAGAVVLNVTVTQPSADGNIVVFPKGTAMPLASNLNFVPGRTIPNLVTVMVGAGGKVTLTNNSTGTVHLVADVSGYYRAGAATLPGMFTPLAPARILDTRSGNGAPTGVVAGGGGLDLQVTGRGGVPAAGVGAVVLNLTVTQPSWDGNVVAYPAGGIVPLASNVNFAAGQTVPNLVTVKVGAGGKVGLRNNSTGTVHLVADVAGYYRDGPAMASGAFVPISPKRILDSRNGTGLGAPGLILAGSAIQQPSPAGAGGPVGAAIVLNVTVTQPHWDGTVVVYPEGTAPPLASNLNFVAGQTTANLVIVKVSEFGQVMLKNNSFGDLHLIADLSGFFLT